MTEQENQVRNPKKHRQWSMSEVNYSEENQENSNNTTNKSIHQISVFEITFVNGARLSLILVCGG
jgi:hypothetical protein